MHHTTHTTQHQGGGKIAVWGGRIQLRKIAEKLRENCGKLRKNCGKIAENCGPQFFPPPAQHVTRSVQYTTWNTQRAAHNTQHMSWKTQQAMHNTHHGKYNRQRRVAVAPTGRGVSRRQHVPEVVELGTVRILTVKSE